jgi:HlyD family secretion protein
MDRPLKPTEIRRRRLRKAAITLLVLASLVIGGNLLAGWIRPSIDRQHLRTATVVRGPIEATITASGTVTPATETVMSSPVEARVMRILQRPGALLRDGMPILELDLSQSALEIERLEQQLARGRNDRKRLAITLETSLTELESLLAQKELDLELLTARADRDRRLLGEGLIAKELVRESDTAARKARIEVEQIAERIVQARRNADAEVSSLALDQRILEKELALARQQLELATTRSDRDGVLTWVIPEPGVTMKRGDVLARIADLGSFRVEATASDIHAPRLSTGGRVVVRLGGERLEGGISAVDPTIANGLVRFTVVLQQPSHPSLRNNQRVELVVMAGEERDALQLKKASFVDQGAEGFVYVVEGDTALRRVVRFGVIGDDAVEIVEGLKAGEVVVMNDLREFWDVSELRIR